MAMLTCISTASRIKATPINNRQTIQIFFIYHPMFGSLTLRENPRLTVVELKILRSNSNSDSYIA